VNLLTHRPGTFSRMRRADVCAGVRVHQGPFTGYVMTASRTGLWLRLRSFSVQWAHMAEPSDATRHTARQVPGVLADGTVPTWS
jgi:hypothetical protein